MTPRPQHCDHECVCEGHTARTSEIICLRKNCPHDTRSRPTPAAPEYDKQKIDTLIQTLIFKELLNIPELWKQHDATIRNQMLDDAAKDLKTMENTATLRYESATTKNEEVYQQGIVMGLHMAQKSLRTPGHERGDQR